MTNHRVLLCWIVGFALAATFLVVRVAIPWLVNQHNTSALILSAIVAGLTATGDFYLFREIGRQWVEEKGPHDHE